MLSLFFLMAAFPCLNALGINTSTGNFPCNKCRRPFHDLTQSILHEDECTSPRCMEDVDVPVTADNAPFSCDNCAKTFPSLNSWIRHSQFNCPHTQSPEQIINTSRNVDSAHISLPHDGSLFFCSYHNTSDGSKCSFAAPTRRLLELHMRTENHPFNCPHLNCTSTGIVWKFDWKKYNAHIKTLHGDSAKRMKIYEPHQSTISLTTPLDTQQKSANKQFSASECEAEEASDEEAPESPRRIDSYHASIEEMVGVRINTTIPINTDSSLTKVALDTASRLWHINMNERVCAVCDEHHVLKYMKSLTLTHPDGTFKGSELFSNMQVYDNIVLLNYSIF